MVINGNTRVVGLLGHPVQHSLSPLMQNTGFEVAGLNWIYVPFSVHPENLEQALAGLFHANIAGLNVTVPHKVSVMKHLVGMTDEALKIGAVNLLLRSSEGWIGDNTDGQGFIKALEEAGFVPGGKRGLLLGAGGAARAVAYSLLGAGLEELVICNRTQERGEELVDELVEEYPETSIEVFPWEMRNDGDILDWVDLIVNATTVGMKGKGSDPSVIDFTNLSPTEGPLVADIVYTPRKTPLISQALERGLPVVTGEKMLLYQGVMSWEAWTNHPAPVKEMAKALLSGLQS